MNTRHTLRNAFRRIRADRHGAAVAELAILLPLAMLSLPSFEPTVQPLTRPTDTVVVEQQQAAKKPVTSTPVLVQAESDFTSIGRYTLIIRSSGDRLSSLSLGPTDQNAREHPNTAETRPAQ